MKSILLVAGLALAGQSAVVPPSTASQFRSAARCVIDADLRHARHLSSATPGSPAEARAHAALATVVGSCLDHQSLDGSARHRQLLAGQIAAQLYTDRIFGLRTRIIGARRDPSIIAQGSLRRSAGWPEYDIVATCVVDRDTDGVDRLLRTTPGTRRGEKVLAATVALLPLCIEHGRELRFDRDLLYAAAARAQYRNMGFDQPLTCPETLSAMSRRGCEAISAERRKEAE